MKIEMLGVPAEILDQFGPVSAETAEAMAVGARRRTGATWAVSVTGNAGPTVDVPASGGKEAPVGMVHVGLSGPGETVSFHRHWPTSDRARVRAFAAQMALDLLHRKLSQ